jgi:hypothetical protein
MSSPLVTTGPALERLITPTLFAVAGKAAG